MSDAQVHTALEIAAAIGKSKQAVMAALTLLPETTIVRVHGKAAKAWRVAALPQPLRDYLAAAAHRQGCRSAEELLQIPRTLWKPSIPLDQIAESCFQEAVKLQRGLKPSLLRRRNTDLSAAEREQMGIREHQAAFNRTQPISDRQFRYLLDRTIERDRGVENWDRLEIYLPENLSRKVTLSRNDQAQSDFPDLVDLIPTLGASPDPEKRNFLWDTVFQSFEEAVQSGKAKGKARRELLTLLHRAAPFLAANPTALLTAWKRKRRAWIDGDRQLAALDDKRAANSGRRRAPALPDPDRELLTAAAAKFGGGVDMALRELLSRNKLSAEIVLYYGTSRKCPRLIRSQIKNDVKLEKDSLHGPNAVISAGAYVNRDPNSFASGDWDQSDDMTMVTMWWENTPDGVWLGQGQLLVWIDERSWMTFGCDLISDKAYDGFSIRNSWTAKADQWGLPRQGLSLERGIWKKARIIAGRPDDIDPLQTEIGLRRLGLRFHHATHARVKVIERIYGLHQDYLQAIPGYVGRNAITDKYEAVQKQILLVKAGKEHPSKFFWSKAQMMDGLQEVFLKYNRTPLDGKYHQGLTPAQAYEKHFTDQLVKIPDSCRYLLASNKIQTTIGRNGVSFRFGKEHFNYKSLETGQRRGQPIFAWFNPERPETLCCTDLNSENPFVVNRETVVASHDPVDGTLSQALKENAEHNKYQKDLHRSLKPHYKSDFFQNLFRPNIVSPATLETAQEFKRQEAALESEKVEASDIRRAYAPLGMPPPRHGQSRERAEAAERLLKRLTSEPIEQ